MFPLADTEVPNVSPTAPSEAVSLAVWIWSAQPLAGFTKTYAAPGPVFASRAPATTVLPLMDTEEPNWSRAAPSEAVSLAVSVMFPQPLAGFTKTYAVPCR